MGETMKKTGTIQELLEAGTASLQRQRINKELEATTLREYYECEERKRKGWIFFFILFFSVGLVCLIIAISTTPPMTILGILVACAAIKIIFS
jgi:hypothetical protein